MRRVTLLDLRLGLVKPDEEQQEAIRRVMVPILAKTARRILREQAQANIQAAAGKHE